jgi:glycosyltransferase involved in cell wall biosynthesis
MTLQPFASARATPSAVHSLTVVICTYNRADLLKETLTAVRACAEPLDCDVQIVVVDNNSTDHTPRVIREAQATAGYPIVSITEPRQGKSYALNTALEQSRGEVVALTDDDVLPATDWLVRIVRAFRSDSLVFLFGKVLPRWGALPPPELLLRKARDIWGPLALIDYGDEPTRYTTARFRKLRLPIGANLAIRRDALERVGGWRTDLGRVDNSLVCGEDRELCVRLFRSGLYEGLYDPQLTVHHFVPASRLSRRYFRRWYFWHGRTLARMVDDFYIDLDLRRVPHVARVPRFIYRETATEIRRWIAAVRSGSAMETLIHELHVLQYAGFFFECWRPYRHTHEDPAGPDATHEHAELATQ